MKKSWYLSKELWASVLAVVVFFFSTLDIHPDADLLLKLENTYLALYPLIIGYLRVFHTSKKLAF